jgi:hypothetical protein
MRAGHVFVINSVALSIKCFLLRQNSIYCPLDSICKTKMKKTMPHKKNIQYSGECSRTNHADSKQRKKRKCVKKIRLIEYSDVERVEKEICRLLHCESGRNPVHTTSASYLMFRNRLIRVIADLKSCNGQGPQHGHNILSVHLPQGLAISCSLEMAKRGLNKQLGIVASIDWLQGHFI